jgi:hypothetical protein
MSVLCMYMDLLILLGNFTVRPHCSKSAGGEFHSIERYRINIAVPQLEFDFGERSVVYPHSPLPPPKFISEDYYRPK